jgi:hypothetical protein
LIAVALGGFGLYRALYVPAMLVGPPVPPALVGFLLQAVFGILAGISVWRGARSAPILIVLLGASIAATALVEGFVFGIIPYLRALFEAVAAIAVTLLIAMYVKRLGATVTR